MVHKSAKIAFSGSQNLKICSHKAWYMRKISSHEPWYPSYLDFSKVENRFFRPQKWENFHSLGGTLKRWIHESAEIAFSYGQNAENLLIRSLLPMKPMKRIFRPQKWRKFYTLCEVPWNVGFTNRQKLHIQAAKMRKSWLHEAWYMRKISSHEGWYPRNVDFKNRQNRILRGTLKRWFHETAEIEFSCTKMRKICSFESCYIRKIFSHEAWYP